MARRNQDGKRGAHKVSEVLIGGGAGFTGFPLITEKSANVTIIWRIFVALSYLILLVKCLLLNALSHFFQHSFVCTFR